MSVIKEVLDVRRIERKREASLVFPGASSSVRIIACGSIKACSFGWLLVLICSERKILLAGCWWLVCSDGWWLISQTNKPNN
jgi:hypothetical protein